MATIDSKPALKNSDVDPQMHLIDVMKKAHVSTQVAEAAIALKTSLKSDADEAEAIKDAMYALTEGDKGLNDKQRMDVAVAAIKDSIAGMPYDTHDGTVENLASAAIRLQKRQVNPELSGF